MQKILVNKIKCNKCGDIIESTYRHDFKFCKCGAVAVDGGKDYLRRGGNREDWEELSEYESIWLMNQILMAMVAWEDWLCSKNAWNIILYHSLLRTIWNCIIIVAWRNGIGKRVIWQTPVLRHKTSIKPILISSGLSMTCEMWVTTWKESIYIPLRNAILITRWIKWNIPK